MPVSLYFLSSGTSRCYPGLTTFSPVGQIAHKKGKMKENNHADNVCKSFMSSNEYLPFHSIFPLLCQWIYIQSSAAKLSNYFFLFCFCFVHYIWNYLVNLHGNYSKSGSGNTGLWVSFFFMKLNTQSQRKCVYDEGRNENFMNTFETLLRKFVRLYSII